MKTFTKQISIYILILSSVFLISCSSDEDIEEETALIISKNYNVTNNGANAYIFNNAAFTNAENPNFTLERGKSYTFQINSPGHPFLIKSVQGNGTANIYNGGVTNNGIISGTITFTVPTTAPDTLFYNCEFHGAMTGVITITD